MSKTMVDLATEHYEAFWKPVLEDENGRINKVELIQFLDDVFGLMIEVSKLVSWLTDGKITNINTPFDVIVSNIDHENLDKTALWQQIQNIVDGKLAKKRMQKIYEAIMKSSSSMEETE